MYGNFLKRLGMKILLFTRLCQDTLNNKTESQTVLVIHNMSSTARLVDVDYKEILYGNIKHYLHMVL